MDDAPVVRSLGQLSEVELGTVRAVVAALVDHDRAALERFGAYDGGDPYEPTLRWREWAQVDLVMPEGEPGSWEGEVYGTATTDNPWVAVDVRMWTVQERGPSELWLHLDVAGTNVQYGGMRS